MVIRACFSVRVQVSAAAAALAVALGPAGGSAARIGGLVVSSDGVAPGARIPAVYAYRGCVPGATNRSPRLAWRGAPTGTKSFAVTMFDPDAPTGHGFWHWVMFDIPASAHGLAAGAGNRGSATTVVGAVLGHIDFGFSGYGGPCPPSGDRPHHYVITVRALDVASVPGATAATTGPELIAAMEGHILARGTLVGRFGR